jgi:hypothetical protein
MTIDLKGARRIDWVRPSGCPSGFETKYVVLGNAEGGGIALEIAVADSKNQSGMLPRPLKDLHRIRLAKRAIPLVLAIDTTDGVFIFGPNPEVAPNGPIPHEQAERFLQSVLDELTSVLARARLAALTQALDSTAMPGVKNSGLFANHELRVGVPARSDWQAACERSAAMLSSKGPQLIEKLGFKVGRAGAHAMVLSGTGPHPQAIAVMLDEREAFDAGSPRFAVSPVAYGLRMAEQQGVPWLIMLRGTQLRLYPARIEFGVGRKGLAETFFEVDLPQLTRDNAGYVDLIFSAAALDENGTAYEILKSSTQYAVELGERLRDKVYEEIIPDLALAIADALVERDYEMDAEGLNLAYQLTLRVFFRMLFQVYAEDRKLLPYGENTKYDRNAIKTMAKDFVENPDQEFDEDSTSLWDDLAQVWRVIDSGDRAWGVPAYNGGLFASDKEINEHGYILKDVHISNAVMGPVLKALLLDEADDGETGQIDFRSLSVREFGTIYEGLLESSLGLAEVDLTLDDKGTWIPAKKKDEVYAYAGQVYFHNTSGQRKGTGSYFTPSFVVEHLLERSLDPALDAHLEKVKALLAKQDHAGAGELFFDFRVADLAMGSGHFLTSAIDHIEQRMAAFLAEDGNVIPGVTAELQKLERAAIDALGPDAPEPERSSLLRRQIARRCIYGLDINPIAVELARVSIWIHTFVRGLPMSSLDHNLVCANSLTGIASVEEALNVLVPGRNGSPTFFDAPIEEALESARTVLVDATLLAESTKEESRAASRASRKALKEAETARLLFDAAVLTRIGRGDLVAGTTPSAIAKLASNKQVQTELTPLKPAHMPVLFPEVFLRDKSGFDVLLGNPPWKEVVPDEPRFWMMVRPGIRSLAGADREKEIERLRHQYPDMAERFSAECNDLQTSRRILKATFDMGSGDADLSRAFSWRCWQLLSNEGRIGIVLPKTAFSAEGLELFRRTVLTTGGIESVVFCANTKKWLFDIEARYSVAIAVLSKSRLSEIACAGPFSNYEDFEAGRDEFARFPTEVVLAMTESASIPVISSQIDADIMVTMRQSPSFSSVVGSETPIVRELDATIDKKFFYKPDASDPVKVYSGKSFSFWNSDTGELFAVGSRQILFSELRRKFGKQKNIKSTAYFGWTEEDSDGKIPFERFRVAFAGVTRSTDARTSTAALIPPEVALTNICPYIAIKAGNERLEAFLLGVMNSRIFDWYARKFIETQMNLFFVKAFPVPAFDERLVVKRICEISSRLTCTSEVFSEWAAKVGTECRALSTEERERLIVELDAYVAAAYGLDTHQISRIMETFHETWEFESHLQKVLSVFATIERG